MIAGPMVAVGCAVCGGEAVERVCSAREVRAHLEYLRRFHRRRLRSEDEAALADRADFTQDYATDVVACAACGLVFRSPRPTDQAIARAYAADTYGLQRLAALYEAQLALYRPKARSLRRLLPGSSLILEVGSFVGGFLAAGREVGWDMLGVDPGEEVGAFCAERELPVFPGTLDQLARRWTGRSADCVAVWNAFDQLPDPEPTLQAARRLLRPGGLLALRVPNGECFRWAAAWMRRLPEPLGGWLRAGMAWNNLLAFPYLHGYSVRTLDWLLGWHGFRRVGARADVLCRLADPLTRRWAAVEERGLKLLNLAAARAQSLLPGTHLSLAPWIDVYYRLSA